MHCDGVLKSHSAPLLNRAIGTGGGGRKNYAQFFFVSHIYISKGYYLVYKYICILLFSPSYEPNSTLLLCTDLYVVILKLFNFLVDKISRGVIAPSPLPPVPSTMLKGMILNIDS